MNPTLAPAVARAVFGAACLLVPVAHATAAEAKCTYTAIGKLPLRYTGPGLQITTQGSINGTPADLLVDTGAFQTTLTRTGIERRGIRRYDTGEKSMGIGGMSAIFESKINEMIVGPVRVGRSVMPVVASTGYTPSYDGILGAPFLLQTDVEISLAEKRLTFFVPKNCGDTHLGYWGTGVQAIPMRRHDQDHMNPRFFVRINGHEVEAIIDTGAVISTISSDVARRAGIEFEKPEARGARLVGVGTGTVETWYATVKTFQIGDEIVKNAEMTVEDSGFDGPGVTLGNDFLRAHRVLFAMSQGKLYFSYVGGQPFGQRRSLEHWVVAEAESGNPDAQLALGNAYASGALVPGDQARAEELIAKAAKGGSPIANLMMGRSLVKRRNYAEAAPHLRAALDSLPAERDGAFFLYVARMRTGQPALAKSELAATFSRSADDEWPKPVADFYLGKLSSDELLERAQSDGDSKLRTERRCEAMSAMGDWHRAHSQPEKAKAFDAQVEEMCKNTGYIYPPIGD